MHWVTRRSGASSAATSRRWTSPPPRRRPPLPIPPTRRLRPAQASGAPTAAVHGARRARPSRCAAVHGVAAPPAPGPPDSRQPHGDQRAAAFAVGEAETPAVRLDDLATQRESETGAGGLGGVERQQRIAQRALAQAAATIADFDAEPGL